MIQRWRKYTLLSALCVVHGCIDAPPSVDRVDGDQLALIQIGESEGSVLQKLRKGNPRAFAYDGVLLAVPRHLYSGFNIGRPEKILLVHFQDGNAIEFRELREMYGVVLDSETGEHLAVDRIQYDRAAVRIALRGTLCPGHSGKITKHDLGQMGSTHFLFDSSQMARFGDSGIVVRLALNYMDPHSLDTFPQGWIVTGIYQLSRKAAKVSVTSDGFNLVDVGRD